MDRKCKIFEKNFLQIPIWTEWKFPFNLYRTLLVNLLTELSSGKDKKRYMKNKEIFDSGA